MLRNWDTLKSSEKVNSSSLEYLLKGSVLFICILIFWNSIYYLFVTQNAITHYAMPAKNIFLAGGMDGFHVPQFKGPYDAYPLLVPLSYVYNYFAFGEINEHAAKVIPGLFSIGVIGSTYLLGKHLCNKKTGLFAALLLSFTPLFLRFATSGYTDIPGAFFYTNSILYYWLTYRYRSMKYAILTGLMVGFSIWTKNSTLLIFISILLFFIIQTLFDRLRKTEGHIHLHHLAVILGISLAIGGPWYLRNYLLYGYLVPVRLIVPGNWRYETFWMHYGVPLFKYFGAIGYHVSIVYVFGLFYSFSRLFWKDRKILFLLSFVLPYLIVWVLKFSYDPRFLLTILPLFAVLGIWAVGEGFQRILGSLSRRELTTFILCGILIVPHVAT
jgi:4-amino-4-deoxy-L-arabinose transferase-like glycosyltransferase